MFELSVATAWRIL